MAEDKVPQEQTPAPAWQIKDGKMYIGGTDVTHVLRPRDVPPETEGENPQPPPDPVVEGEEVKEEEPVEAEPEPEAEPKEEEPEEEAETEEEEPEPIEPGPIKLDLKYKGEEYSEELTPEQIAMKLQRLRFLDETQKETFERKKEIEPYWHLVKSDWFKSKLEEARETGEFEVPKPEPEPPDEVMFEIAKREGEEDYFEVLFELQNQAIRMPERAQRIIDSNPNVFLREYDRVAKEVRSRKESPPEKTEKKKTPPKDVEKKLELKESAKKRAGVTKPGQSVEPVTPMKKWAAREKELVTALRDPSNKSKHISIVAELLAHRREKPQPT